MYYRRKGERIMFNEEEFYGYMEKRLGDLAELMANGVLTILIMLGGYSLFMFRLESNLYFLAILGVPFLIRYPTRKWLFRYLSKMFLELLAIRESSI
jgi:hypothetical protein